jgi:selenium metabolism protein YedF
MCIRDRANSMGCGVEIEQEGNEYRVHITKKSVKMSSDDLVTGNIVLLISASELGRGSAELGDILMKSFVFTLVESDKVPQTILFVNSGVYLTCADSAVLEHLINLRNHGVEILSCGTCLDYFNLQDKLAVGQVSNRYTIYEKMSAADKVITI